MYTAAAGMLADQMALDAIAQNLANASTTGYKQDVPRFQAFRDTLLQRMDSESDRNIGSIGRGASIHALVTDFSGGSLQRTGNTLDIALTGDANLAIQGANGITYSRDGALTRNASGALVQTGGGGEVLNDRNQPITIPATAKDITITAQGDVIVDKQSVGRIKLVAVNATTNAVKLGENQFQQAAEPAPSADSSVQQGFLESSNVSVIKEMVNMITVMRAYETDQKMMQSEDDATNKAVSDVSKV